jgi:hypothetical protein
MAAIAAAEGGAVSTESLTAGSRARIGGFASNIVGSRAGVGGFANGGRSLRFSGVGGFESGRSLRFDGAPGMSNLGSAALIIADPKLAMPALYNGAVNGVSNQSMPFATQSTAPTQSLSLGSTLKTISTFGDNNLQLRGLYTF